MPGGPLKPELFQTVSRQAAIWTDEFDPGTREVMKLVTGPWSDLLDGEPVVLPSGPGLPEGVPRVTVSSEDEQWRLQVAARRVDMFWQLQGEEITDEHFTKAVTDTLRPYLELGDKVRVIRMAYVVRRLARSEAPARELARLFCRDALLSEHGPLNRPSAFEVHAHKRYNPKGLPEVNSWIRWTTATLAKDDSPVISVVQDLNTLAGQPPEEAYDIKQAQEFFTLTPAETEHILRLYLESLS